MSELALKLIAEAKATKATSIDLGMCGLTEIPEELFELIWLEELYLCNAYWDYDKEQWIESKNKKSEKPNFIETLPKRLGKLSNLKALLINGDFKYGEWWLSNINVLRELKQLKILTLRSNNINDINALKELKELKTLDLRYNKQIKNFNILKELKELEILDLNSNDIDDINMLKELKELKRLHLSSNNIINITNLKELKELKKLHLSSNNINDINPLKKLKQLQTLDLSSNNIDDINALKELKELQKLYLSYNNINDINALKELKQLQILYLSVNNVADINPLEKLTKLKILHLGFNNINNINVLKELKKIHTLHLSFNNIEDFSPVKEHIQNKLEIEIKSKHSATRGKITVYENPIKIPSIETIKQGHQSVLKYFEELDRQGTDYLFEAKLLIIGDGGAGKTTLAKKLMDAKAEMPKEEESTKGIEIYKLKFKCTQNSGADFTINIWDFGGQEIYKSTHQFFLTKRSLYVLVDSTRTNKIKEKDDFERDYWLQTAELMGDGSPLLLVQNEVADRSKDINFKGIKGRFEFVKEKFESNLLDNRGLEKILSAIQYHIERLPHVGQIMPKQWKIIRGELEQIIEIKPYISDAEFFTLCSKHQIPEKERALFLSQTFHDLGIFLHFQKDPILKQVIFLQNEWATDAVYKVLDNETVKERWGRFDDALMKDIWAESLYTDKHEELLALMKNFELCYEIPDQKPRLHLVPQLLPESEPEQLKWDNNNNLQLRYRYGFMPKGLLSKLIVRLHRYIQDLELSWNSGTVLEKDQDTKALVIETYGQKEISIRVIGFESKVFLNIITEQLDLIHKKFEGIKVAKLVPCNCQTCKKLYEPHFYEYALLIERLKVRKATIECKNHPFENVNIRGMMDTVFENFQSKFSGEEEEYRQHLDLLPNQEEQPSVLGKKEIKKLLQKGKEEEAIDKFLDGSEYFQQKELHRNIIHLSSRFYKNEEEKRKGTKNEELYNQEANQIRNALLDYLEEYKG